MKLKNLFFIVVLLVSGCSSTPPLNVDNDFWFGELTRTGSSGVAFAGFGFEQTGSEIKAALAVSDGTQTVTCCVLTGSLNGRELEASFVEANNDSVTVSGTFSSDTSFAGTLRFIVEGKTDEYNLQMSYESELDAALMSSFARTSSGIKRIKGLLE